MTNTSIWIPIHGGLGGSWTRDLSIANRTLLPLNYQPPKLPFVVIIKKDIIIYNNFSLRLRTGFPREQLIFRAANKKMLKIYEEGESVANVPASVHGISYFIYFEWPTNVLWSSTSELKMKHIPHSEQSHIFFKSSGFKFDANTISECIVFN